MYSVFPLLLFTPCTIMWTETMSFWRIKDNTPYSSLVYISRNTENIEGYDPAIDSPRSPLSNADMNVTKYFYILLKKYTSFNEAFF